MVSVTLFEVCCKSHVSFCCCVGCYDCLVDYVRFEAFSFKGAFVFCTLAVTLVVGLFRVGDNVAVLLGDGGELGCIV